MSEVCVNQASDTRAADVSNASKWTNSIGALAQIHAVSIYQIGGDYTESDYCAPASL